MKLAFTSKAEEDFNYWLKVGDQQMLKRIRKLLDDLKTGQDPFTGIGKPEPLRHNRAGTWSRRITQEHRLTYLVKEDTIVITGLRFHY
jgi:toxin YoeB